MLSINTNLPSLIAQKSLKNSTLKLNTAIERMTTGFKINSAKDNAANYSITTNMSTKIGAYEVAEDNVAAGMDLISIATDSLDLVDDKLARLRALAEQASNGTYGGSSLKAINAEANAIVDEINRVYASANYNNLSLFGDVAGKFINEVQRRDTSQMTKLAEVDSSQTLTSGTYSISSAKELAKLAEMTNNKKIGANCEFVLACNIDLSAYSDGEGWIPIGDNTTNPFKAKFDGNGYKISNLKIDGRTDWYSAVFGAALNAEFKNLGVENIYVNAKAFSAGLVGRMENSTVNNCYVDKGSVYADESNVGGITGCTAGTLTMTDCYSTLEIVADNHHGGGLVGNNFASDGNITNCFATGNVSGAKSTVGGLIGTNNMTGKITNCFATGDVTGGDGSTNSVGGLIGQHKDASGTLGLINCYYTGNVSSYKNAAGLVGNSKSSLVLQNCFSTGNITSSDGRAAGLVGEATRAVIVSCYATGDMNGKTGSGLVDYVGESLGLSSSYYEGNITVSDRYSGGLVGAVNGMITISNSHAIGHIESALNRRGGLVGGFVSFGSGSTIRDSYANMSIGASGDNTWDGGLVGDPQNSVRIDNSYYNSDTGLSDAGGTGVSLSELNSLISNGTIPDVKLDLEAFEFDLITYYSEQSIGLQVGISGSESSRIEFSTSLGSSRLDSLRKIGLKENDYLGILDNMISYNSGLQTNFGAISNRLESVLDEISTQRDNLLSSRSTLRDADIADVSSEYIRQQILQQASATLLATANQSPALALQLI